MYENPKLSIECMLSPYDGNYRKQNKLSYHSEQVQEMFERRVMWKMVWRQIWTMQNHLCCFGCC